MQAVRAKHTKAELRVRKLLHAMGYRFRLHFSGLPGRPDIVFPARRRAIEVRGCFWHQHPDPLCRNAVLPATRREWWAEKLEGNVVRDARNLARLEDAGWEVLVLWECELTHVKSLEARLIQFLGPTRMRAGAQGGAFRDCRAEAYSHQ
jgi:DNA mismatch endonuclease Vsr